MKKITLNFYGLGYGCCLQALVKIYDQYGKLVFNGKTYNGKIEVCLKSNNAYRVFAQSCGNFINTAFYVSNNYSNYSFYFNRVLQENENTVTFLLTDYYYNLPIKKGEIILG